MTERLSDVAKPTPAHEVMANKIESLITRFDMDADQNLSLNELSAAKTGNASDDDKKTIDFAERYFGVLSILDSNPQNGISRTDVREFGRTMWKPFKFPEVEAQMNNMYEELYPSKPKSGGKGK